MKKIISLILAIAVCLSSDVFAEETINPDDKGGGIYDQPSPLACLNVEDSCSVEIMQSIYCELRGYSCLGDTWPLKFSWGLTASIHAKELDTFTAPQEVPEWIKRQTKPILKDLGEYIDHEAIEHLICQLEGKKACMDGSLYKAANQGANCSKYPKTCGGSKY